MSTNQFWFTGTASVTQGSTTVTGTLTAWQTGNVGNGIFYMNGVAMGIAEVVSETELTLIQEWPGLSGSGEYWINRENSDASDVIDLHDRMTKSLRTLSLAGLKPDYLGTLTYRDTIVLGPLDKKLFLHAELGEDFEWYVWDGPTDESWLGPFPVAQEGDAGPPGLGDKYAVAVFAGGRPRPSELLLRHVFADAINFPTGLTTSEASSGTAANAEAVFTIELNGAEVGTITFAASSDEGVFAAPSPITTADGDVMEIYGPTSQDADLANVSITIVGDR